MNKTLLIVDDDISLCKMLEILLKDLCPIKSFYDVKSAAKYLDDHQEDISLMMLDYNIGSDNGVNFYKQEVLGKGLTIPAVLISGFIVTQLKTKEELDELDSMFKRVIEKPFDFVELRDYLEREYFH
ncbi:response regulator [Thermoproteota archaeon]